MTNATVIVAGRERSNPLLLSYIFIF